MENIISNNQELVNKGLITRITSKVEANKGHTRLVLVDKEIHVRVSGGRVKMRCMILTDKENSLYYQRLRLINLEYLCENTDIFIRNSENSPYKKYDEIVANQDEGGRSHLCVWAPTHKNELTSRALETSKLLNRFKKYVIGFDSEWREGPGGRRDILSYQLSMYIEDKGLVEFILFVDGRRLSLGRLLSIFTQELRYELGIDIGVTAYNKHEKVICYLVAHYDVVDITALFNSKGILRRTDTVRRTQVSITKPLFVDVYDKSYNYKQRWIVYLRDTMTLAPTQTSLERLAESMGKIKLELPPGYDKNDMGRFLKEQEDEFVLYACNDATLTVDYTIKMYPQGAVPVTLGSEGAKRFKQKLKEIKNWKERDFNYQFRGLKTVKDENDPKKRKLEPRLEAAAPLAIATQCFYGGRNECFLYGIHHSSEGWYDYDLTGAYPTAMSMLRTPDFDKVAPLSGDIFDINPLDYIFGLVDFEFPPNTMFPCLPVKDDEGRGLIFPRKGRTYAAAPELYLALRMGAKLRWVQAGVKVGTTGKLDIKEVFADLLKARAEAKKLYGKGSVQEVKIKELVNSIYGKTGQGLAGKRNYSTRTDSVEDTPPSIITQPLLAATTTSLVRAFVSAAMHQLHLLGYRIASVTTDGFLCDAPFEVLKSLDLFGFKDVYEAFREAMVGDPTMWEIKHKCKTLIMITTRGGFGIGRIGEYALPSAKAGYKPEEQFFEMYSDCMTDELSRRFLGRQGKLETYFTKLPSPKDYLRKGADGIGVWQKKSIEWEYDLKRKPVNPRMESVTIGDQIYEHVSFDSVPWETIQDFAEARAIKKAHPELYPLKDTERAEALLTMIKERENIRKAGMLIQNASKGGVYRTACISYLRDLMAGREPMPAWAIGLSYRKLAEAINERLKHLNVSITVKDIKNAKQRKDAGRLEDSETLQLIKELLK